MRLSIKLTLAFVLIALASVEIVAQENADLIGSYLFRHEWGGSEIVIKQNGMFTASSSDCTSVTTASGPYLVSNNVIRFTTTKLTIRDFSDNQEHDLTKRKNRKKYLETDEPFRPDTLELEIVRWGKRVYLMDSEWYGPFVKAINLGLEPRPVDGYRAYYGRFYLRVGDEDKDVTGPPPLPEEFLRQLLPAPIVATVLELKPDDTFSIATIDRGSVDGLKAEMPLVAMGEMMHFQPFRIISVKEHSAEVRVWGDVKVGDQLTTRIPNVRQLSE